MPFALLNQKKPEKLNHQLSLMPHVYYEASSVIIWLGKDDATTREAVHTLYGLQREEVLMMESMMRCEVSARLLRPLPRSAKARPRTIVPTNMV